MATLVDVFSDGDIVGMIEGDFVYNTEEELMVKGNWESDGTQLYQRIGEAIVKFSFDCVEARGSGRVSIYDDGLELEVGSKEHFWASHLLSRESDLNVGEIAA